MPNEFTLCNALHDFLTLYVKRSREKWHLLACTIEKTKEKVKSNLDLPLYLEVIEIDQECTVPAQIERRRSNFRLGFFGEDFTK